MKSLFQNIRAGVITRPACEGQLAKFKFDKLTLTRAYLAKALGQELYSKKLAEMNFCIEMLQSIIDKWDDLRMPLKVKAVKPAPVSEVDTEDNWTNEGGDYGG